MNFLWHLLIGILLLSSYFWIGNAAIIIAIAYVAVDIDHIQILIKEKAFSVDAVWDLLVHGYEKYEQNPKNAFDGQIFILHSIEFLIILLIAAYFWYPKLYYVAAGVGLHILTDVIHHLIMGFPVIKWLFLSSNLF
jgi:hypothetical protein